MIMPIREIRKLSLHERLQLVEDVWDSIVMEEADLEVPQWQKEELDRREVEFKRNPSGIPWSTAKELIRGRHLP